jgi:hypothetical protein
MLQNALSVRISFSVANAQLAERQRPRTRPFYNLIYDIGKISIIVCMGRRMKAKDRTLA